MRNALLILVSIIIYSSCLGQNLPKLYFHINKSTIKITGYDSLLLEKNKILNELHFNGYTGLSIKDSTFKKNEIHYLLGYKNQFKNVLIRSQSTLLKTPLFKANKYIDQVITELENNGYPFAKVIIDSTNELPALLVINYHVDTGSLFTIAKIHLKSNSEFNKPTLLNLLNLEVGEVYNESKINQINKILTDNKLYKPLRSYEILFREKTAELYIYFEKNNISNADGFMGFQQNPLSRKLELNGNLDFNLVNALNRAEQISFNWKSNPNLSQKLNSYFNYPFLLNIPIGIAGKLAIQKQDTSFIRNSVLGNLQFISPNYNTGIFIEQSNSFLINNVENNDFVSFKKTIYGIQSEFTLLNTKKQVSNIKLKIGLFNYYSDSSEIEFSTSNLILESTVDYKLKLTRFFNFQSSLNFHQLNTSYLPSKNELFYFGGLKSVRGFYELELIGNTVFYCLNSIEYKPINSLSFQLIYDYSQFHSNTFVRTNSIGFGFNLINQNNTLSLIIANGKSSLNPIDFNDTKLHIGFVSKF